MIILHNSTLQLVRLQNITMYLITQQSITAYVIKQQCICTHKYVGGNWTSVPYKAEDPWLRTGQSLRSYFRPHSFYKKWHFISSTEHKLQYITRTSYLLKSLLLPLAAHTDLHFVGAYKISTVKFPYEIKSKKALYRKKRREKMEAMSNSELTKHKM
jgi:hypothetical protein